MTKNIKTKNQVRWFVEILLKENVVFIQPNWGLIDLRVDAKLSGMRWCDGESGQQWLAAGVSLQASGRIWGGPGYYLRFSVIEMMIHLSQPCSFSSTLEQDVWWLLMEPSGDMAHSNGSLGESGDSVLSLTSSFSLQFLEFSNTPWSPESERIWSKVMVPLFRSRVVGGDMSGVELCW